MSRRFKSAFKNGESLRAKPVIGPNDQAHSAEFDMGVAGTQDRVSLLKSITGGEIGPRATSGSPGKKHFCGIVPVLKSHPVESRNVFDPDRSTF